MKSILKQFLGKRRTARSVVVFIVAARWRCCTGIYAVWGQVIEVKTVYCATRSSKACVCVRAHG